MHMNWSVRLNDKLGPYSPRHLKLEFEEFDHGFVYRRLREGMKESDSMWTTGRVCLSGRMRSTLAITSNGACRWTTKTL